MEIRIQFLKALSRISFAVLFISVLSLLWLFSMIEFFLETRGVVSFFYAMPIYIIDVLLHVMSIVLAVFIILISPDLFAINREDISAENESENILDFSNEKKIILIKKLSGFAVLNCLAALLTMVFYVLTYILGEVN